MSTISVVIEISSFTAKLLYRSLLAVLVVVVLKYEERFCVMHIN